MEGEFRDHGQGISVWWLLTFLKECNTRKIRLKLPSSSGISIFLLILALMVDYLYLELFCAPRDEFYFREEVHFCKLYAADHGFTIPSVDCMHKYLAGKTYTNLGVLNVVLM